ncbi:Kelch repeat-containing protein [Hymenobacter siberiensis]|jgi:N-acetylneuraminic acid mutarotase|uniref:Kelch repeat-containing protein n=1 Tax=Hymenobacter siberiensis TaxID=2848396 RepID=UPI001C1E228D|nr:galactose oxidase [Hymenobacter siberiensis]MBU6122719.1 galactose oxidase [Hymenobacter siberiensis]
MKTTRLLAVLLLILASLNSCTKDSTDVASIIGAWYGRSQFEGLARSGAVSFVIDGKAYVGLGTDGTDKYTNFWQYVPGTNTWKQLAPFPGVGRYQAVAFAANDKGYVGTGYDGNYKKDFWQYDPSTDVWTQKPSFGGNKRLGAVAFVANNEGYICTGLDNGTYQTDNWSYNPTTETWTEHRKLEGTTTNGTGFDFSAVPRAYGVAFTIANTSYVTLGSKDTQSLSCWAYSPTDDSWHQKTEFSGAFRTLAAAFGLGDYGYVGLRVGGSIRYDDLWKLEPATDVD